MGEVRAAWLRRLAGLGLAAGTAVAVTTGGSAPAAAAEGQILDAGAADAIAGSYVVVLKDTARKDTARKDLAGTSLAASVRDLTSRYGGRVGHTYSAALSGFSVQLTEQQARRLAADPLVDFVEQDRQVRLTDTQTGATWGIDRIDQPALPLSGTYTYSTTADNVTAYVIDTGVRASHSEFGGRASSGYDFVDDDTNTDDCQGHGTHVAGTIGGSTYGVAKGVRIVGVRVLDCAGSGSYSDVIAGIDWVTANHASPAVANMSLGGSVYTAVDKAVQRSIASGVTYGVAAGNNGANACSYSPARTPEAITVGATTNTDARASYSNYGSCVDIFAPGTGITSAWNSGDTATNTISGTSMATPHVVGAAALYLAGHPAATPAQVRDALVGAGSTGVVTNPGTNSPNVLLHTGSL